MFLDAIMSYFMVFGVGWAMAIWFSANGIYALAKPAQWLGAKWTVTRGFRPQEAPSARHLLHIRCFGGFLLACGIAVTIVISFVSFVALRQWYEGYN
jgi:hypothetical protein